MEQWAADTAAPGEQLGGGSVPCSRVSPQSRTLPARAGIRTHNLGLPRVSSPTLYSLGHDCPSCGLSGIVFAQLVHVCKHQTLLELTDEGRDDVLHALQEAGEVLCGGVMGRGYLSHHRRCLRSGRFCTCAVR